MRNAKPGTSCPACKAVETHGGGPPKATRPHSPKKTRRAKVDEGVKEAQGEDRRTDCWRERRGRKESQAETERCWGGREVCRSARGSARHPDVTLGLHRVRGQTELFNWPPLSKEKCGGHQPWEPLQNKRRPQEDRLRPQTAQGCSAVSSLQGRSDSPSRTTQLQT